MAAALVAGLAVASPAGSAPLTTDPGQAAVFGAAWLAGQVNDQGYIPGPTNDPDASATIEAALALAAAGASAGQPAFGRVVTWAEAHSATLVEVSGQDDPGRLGYLLNLARVAGADPHDFGGIDLVARLADTLGDYAPGLYGAGDPTFDGSFRQSLAITGLLAVGQAPPPAAIGWLVAQQCTAPATSAGGYLGYRADTSVDCPAPDPVNFTGPDTNGTALAVQALAAAGRTDAAAAGLDFLARAQDASGGIAFIPGGTADPNSEALTAQAIIALGETPSLGRWRKGANTLTTALLSWQVGTTGAPEDRGGFASPFSSGFPDLYATRQAIWGAAGRAFPFTFTAFADGPPASSSTSTTTASTGPTITGVGRPDRGTAASSSLATTAARVSVTPRFTG